MTPMRLLREASGSIMGSALVALWLGACGGATDSGGKTLRVAPGDSCSVDGESAQAIDGCNTCTCTNGVWACTEKACSGGDGGTTPGKCKPGETTNDGCNTCTCTEDGLFACTLRACPPAECQEGDVKSVDGCNTCKCSQGGWICTNLYCPPPPVCTDGTSTNDGCNTCTCMNGQWACTARACPPPPPVDAGVSVGCGGWLGDTCTATEYCAYEPGQYCGGADASSVCKPRPQACDTLYDPVCGCDQKDYGNACEAAMAGTGVYTKGMCAQGI